MRKPVSRARPRLWAAVLCLLAAAACGNGGDGDGEVVEVTFWHAMGGPLGSVLTSLVDDFNATHPGIRVESVSMGRYTALSQKIMAAVAAGKPPVMAQAYENWTIELILSESIVPIERFVRGPDGLDRASMEDILPVFIENNTWGETLWSFPFNKSVRTLFYNKDLFEASGLDSTHPPANWEEYLGFARAITEDTDGDGHPDIWGTAGQVNVWMFGNLLLQNGGYFLDPVTQRVVFNRPEGVEALSFMKTLLAGDVGFIASGYEYQNDFLARKVGMIEGSTVSLAFIRGKYDFNLGIAPLPEGKQPGVTIAGTNVVIFSKATERQQRAAWEFIKWFTDTDQTARWAAGTFYVPVRRSAFETEALQQRFEAFPGLRQAFNQLEYASFEPRIAGWYAGRRYLSERAIEAVLRGDADIADALDRAAAKAEAEVQRAMKLKKKLGLGEGS
jgi:multiple sugar transport system substrate-binding protein